MEWLIIGLLGFLGHAISTSLDKTLMTRKNDAIVTSIIKLFVDGLVVLAVGLAFFEFNVGKDVVLWSLIIGALYAAGSIVYYHSLKSQEIGVQVAFVNASATFAVFLGGVWVLGESAGILNLMGVVFILVGVYLVLAKRYRLPRINMGLLVMVVLVVLIVSQNLVTKHALNFADALPLAAMMYFSAVVVTGIYQVFRTPQIPRHVGRTAISGVFGGSGTMLIFTAVAMVPASKIYPVGGVTSVFAFLIGIMFLREKFTWAKLLGTISVFIGIFLVSI